MEKNKITILGENKETNQILDDPDAAVALKRLNDKTDEVISMDQMKEELGI